MLAAPLGVILATSVPTGALAADVISLSPSLSQGTTKFKGKTKFKAHGALNFRTMKDGVACKDSLSLERRVREVVNRKIRFRWILIRGGDQKRSCQETPTGAKPAKESTSREFLNNPDPYRALLAKTPLRLRYSVRVTVNGRLAYRKTLISPVTRTSLSKSFRQTA